MWQTKSQQHTSAEFFNSPMLKTFKTMERFINIVKQDQSSTEIQKDRLKLLSKVKVWDYAKIRQVDYQNLYVEDRSSLLKSY